MILVKLITYWLIPEGTTDGLIAHWKLDESSPATTAADSSGSGNDGTLYGSPTWQTSGGQIGGALEFNSSGDYVDITSFTNIPVGNTARTISFLFNTHVFSTTDCILSYGQNSNGQAIMFFPQNNAIAVAFAGHRVQSSTTYLTKNKWTRRWFKLTHILGLWLLILSASRTPFAAYVGAAILVIGLVSWQEKTWGKKIWNFFKRTIGLGLLISFLLLFFGKDIYERFLQVIEGYPKVIATYHEINAQQKQARDEQLAQRLPNRNPVV